MRCSAALFYCFFAQIPCSGNFIIDYFEQVYYNYDVRIVCILLKNMIKIKRYLKVV